MSNVPETAFLFVSVNYDNGPPSSYYVKPGTFMEGMGVDPLGYIVVRVIHDEDIPYMERNFAFTAKCVRPLTSAANEMLAMVTK